MTNWTAQPESHYTQKCQFIIVFQNDDIEIEKGRIEFPPATSVYQYFTKLATDVENNKDQLKRLDVKMDKLQETLKAILDKVSDRNETNDNPAETSSSDVDQSVA